jgi:hypothetical protein
MFPVEWRIFDFDFFNLHMRRFRGVDWLIFPSRRAGGLIREILVNHSNFEFLDHMVEFVGGFVCE